MSEPHANLASSAQSGDMVDDQVSASTAPCVLLVEDETMIALNLEALVEDMGFAVTGLAADSGSARALAEANPPDVAVVDLNLLDGRTGLALAGHLFRTFGTVVIIATGNPEGIEVGGGVFAIVRKPYTNEALERVIRLAAALRRGGQQLHDRVNAAEHVAKVNSGS